VVKNTGRASIAKSRDMIAGAKTEMYADLVGIDFLINIRVSWRGMGNMVGVERGGECCGMSRGNGRCFRMHMLGNL